MMSDQRSSIYGPRAETFCGGSGQPGVRGSVIHVTREPLAFALTPYLVCPNMELPDKELHV